MQKVFFQSLIVETYDFFNILIYKHKAYVIRLAAELKHLLI